MVADLRPRRIAWVAELTALSLSIVANVAATARGGLGGVAAGVAIPVLIVLTVYLWRAFPGAGTLQRSTAAVAMTAVVVPVVIVSYVHVHDTLLATGVFSTWMAWVLPVSVDGLAVRAALALWSPAKLEVPAAVIEEIETEHNVDVLSEFDEDGYGRERPHPLPEPSQRPTRVEPADANDEPAFGERGPDVAVADSAPSADSQPMDDDHPDVVGGVDPLDRARELVRADPSISYRKLQDALNVSKHQAGQYKKRVLAETHDPVDKAK